MDGMADCEAKGVSPDVPKRKNRLAEKSESWYNSRHEEDNKKSAHACRYIDPKVYEYGFLKKVILDGTEVTVVHLAKPYRKTETGGNEQ